MNLLDLVDMLELDAETRSPTSPIKLVTTGKIIGLKEGNRVIDFGCGCGEALALWGKYFGITGVGIDGDQRFCERAVDRVAQEGLSEQIEIVYGNAAEYDFEEHAYDMASCISASMIWGGFRASIRRMKDAIHSEGKVVIGEAYYTCRDVSPELIEYEGHYHTELELFEIAREEGFQVGYMARSSREDWDRYVFANQVGTIGEIKAIPDDAERRQHWVKFLRWQDIYIKYRQEYQGFAIYVFYPVDD